MCVVSMIGDHYSDKWKDYKPIIDLNQQNEWNYFNNVSRHEFEELKKDVLEMKELLKKAKDYDELNNEPDCEMEDKIELLKKIAELVGVDLSEIFETK